jgi:hypothetical protein
MSFECLPHRLIVTAVTPSQALAGPAFPVKPYGLAALLLCDAALPDGNACATQMFGHSCPMQLPAFGELQHAVASLVFGEQPRDLQLGETTLLLPLCLVFDCIRRRSRAGSASASRLNREAWFGLPTLRAGLSIRTC